MGRDVQARDRREAWQAVAERVGGTFSEGKWVTGGYAVRAVDGPWTLTLGLRVVTAGTATVVQTRVLAIFLGREDLRLTVRQRTVVDRLAEMVGFAGIPVGQRELARRYIVRGRPKSNVRSILSGGLAAVLAERGPFRLEVSRAPRRSRKEMGPNARQLQVTAPGVDTDVGHMAEMFAVAREVLDVLQRVGVASRAD